MWQTVRKEKFETKSKYPTNDTKYAIVNIIFKCNKWREYSIKYFQKQCVVKNVYVYLCVCFICGHMHMYYYSWQARGLSCDQHWILRLAFERVRRDNVTKGHTMQQIIVFKLTHTYVCVCAPPIYSLNSFYNSFSFCIWQLSGAFAFAFVRNHAAVRLSAF